MVLGGEDFEDFTNRIEVQIDRLQKIVIKKLNVLAVLGRLTLRNLEDERIPHVIWTDIIDRVRNCSLRDFYAAG